MRAALAASAIAALLVTSPAAAQGDRAEARALFEQGVTALEEGRFAEAEALLQRSLELRDSPPARFNRAVALRGAGRYLEAIAEVERYLEQATEPRYERTREHAEAMRAELREAVAVLTLEVTGEPDEVRVDDEVVSNADAQLELRRDPGAVHVVVTRAGYATVERTIELASGAREAVTLDASESPLPARLRVEALPPGVAITVDGVNVGVDRVELERPAGTYAIGFAAEGFLPQDRSVTLEPGGESSVSVSLNAIPPTPVEEQWWFWTAIGAGAVAIGIAIGVAVVFATDTQDLELGSLGFSQEVLRWSM